MKIKKVVIQNFRGIDSTSIDLNKKLNVFVGANGAGKSTILDAIVISLSWLVNRIQRENSSGKPITESNIKNDTPFATIETEILKDNSTYSWRVARTLKGEPSIEKSELVGASELASLFQSNLKLKDSLPIIAYYPVDRVVSGMSPDLSNKESINILDVYDNSLGGRTNYQSFFEWFRLQDDIINERVNSRTKWMISHKSWVRQKTNKLLLALDKIVEVDKLDSDHVYRIRKRLRNGDFIFDEPRHLFSELGELVHFARYSKKELDDYSRIIHELEFMLHKMGSLSDSHRDNLIELNEYPFRIIEHLLNDVLHIFSYREQGLKDLKAYYFVWEALQFSVLLSLWWTSEKCKSEVEDLFKSIKRTIHKWDSVYIQEFVSNIRIIVDQDLERYRKATISEGRELYYVTKTIENFIPEYSNLRISRIPRPHMLVDKSGVSMVLDQLSDGEKNLIALIGDISRRLSIANPYSENPLKGDGIILIDEIDLHLHPGWQRLMLPQLAKTFPNCQFIVTTHSPQVISHAKAESIFLLKLNKGQFSYSKATESYGKNSDRILEDLLGVDARPAKEKRMIRDLYSLIQIGNLNEAKKKAAELLDLIGEDPEITKAQALIIRKETIGK